LMEWQVMCRRCKFHTKCIQLTQKQLQQAEKNVRKVKLRRRLDEAAHKVGGSNMPVYQFR
jgi:hypothetical protein